MRSDRSLCVCSLVLIAFLGVALPNAFCGNSANAAVIGDSAKIILQRYANAWRGRGDMLSNRELIVAFWIKGEAGGKYHVILSDKPCPAVADGDPATYDFRFETDIELLRRVDRGQLSALTAMAKARDTDITPLSWKAGKAVDGKSDTDLLFRRLCLMFWKRDWPPTFRFGHGLTREVHGANATALLYEDRFRSAWYQLKPGMHMFAGGQKAPFGIFLVVTKGRASARLDGKARLLSEGDAVFIPAGMTFEYWAEPDQYGEVIWIAFGDGA